MSEVPPGLLAIQPAGGFFDWASLSPPSRAAAAARATAVAATNEQIDAPGYVREQTLRLDGLRLGLQTLLNVGDREAPVTLGRSVSELMSVLAMGLAMPDARRRVVLWGPTHPSVVLAWRAAAEVRGIELLFIEGDHDGAPINDALAVVVTHVDHLSGSEQPIQQAVEWARSAGAYSIVDGAQAVGRVPVDLAAIAADAYLGSGRKALLAPLGTAFMLASPRLLSATWPSLWSTRSAALGDRGEIVTAPGATRLEGNLPDLAALAGLAANVELVTPSVLSALTRHVDNLMPLLRARMVAVGLFEQVPTSGCRNAGIVTFQLPPSIDGLMLQRHLSNCGIVIAATTTHLRFSVHFANTESDVDRLAEEVSRYAA